MSMSREEPEDLNGRDNLVKPAMTHYANKIALMKTHTVKVFNSSE
jgi:hypothetical protein